MIAPAAAPLEADIERLEQATSSATPSAESASQLEALIEAAETHPLALARDPAALEVLARARLALVWVLLEQDPPAEAEAEAMMDAAILGAMSRALPAGNFGTKVLALHDRRQRALRAAGSASIALSCEGCELIINERRSPNPSEALPLGNYRVWAVPAEGEGEPQRFEVELGQAGTIEHLEYERHASAATPTPPPPTPSTSLIPTSAPPSPASSGSGPEPELRPLERLLPRWTELLGVAAGVGLLVTGGVLSALQDRCLGDPSNSELDTCKRLYQNHPQDYVLMAAGGGIVATFGVMLAVDEVRRGRVRGRQAVISWKLRF